MFELFKSIITSIGRGIYYDPEVQKILARHPRLFHFIRKRLTPDEKFGLYLTLGVFITLIFMFLFFGVLEDLVSHDPLVQADLRIVNVVQIFRNPTFNKVMLFITYLGKWQIVLSGVLAITIFLILLKRWHYIVALITSVGCGEGFIWLLKNIIQRPRPPLINALAPEASFSFPSGHSFVAFSFYGLFAYFLFREMRGKFSKILGILAVICIIIAIGFSRIYLGVHWPSDVLASYALGAAWLAALITPLEIRRRFNFYKTENPYVKKSSVVIWIGIILFSVWGLYLGYFFKNHPISAGMRVPIHQTIISEKEIPQNLFSALPRTSENITGGPMEPIHLIFVASREGLDHALTRAGWFPTDPITFKTLWRIIYTSLLNKPYPQAPGTPSFWNAQPNDFAYEKPSSINSVRERHHVHLWKTPFILDNQRAIWFGTAHFDKSIL